MSAAKGRVPLRTCVNCGNRTDKRQLVRIVASPDGITNVDRTGRMNGRGTYLCLDDTDCKERELNRGRVERALRTSISPEAWQALVAEAASERAEASVN